MNEIKESEKGILHPQSKRLSTKKSVYTDAWIYGIPHSEAIEVSLNARKFFSYDEDDKDIGNLLLKFKNVVKNNKEIAKALLDNELFTEDVQIAINAIRKNK